MQGEHLAVGEAEGRRSGDEQRCGVGAGLSSAVLAGPPSVAELMALRGALRLLATREVEHLGEVVGHREHDLQSLQQVRVRSGVREAMARSDRSARKALVLGTKLESCLVVGGFDGQLLAMMVEASQ